MIFLVNIGQKLANKIPSCCGSPLDFIPGNFTIISSFKPTDYEELSEIIDNLKTSSAGHDNISPFLVK